MATDANTTDNWLKTAVSATNTKDNWLKMAVSAGKLKKKLIELNLNKNVRNDINSLFRSLCRFIIFFPLLTREESPKLFPYINYTIFQIIRRLVIREKSYKINKSLFYNIVIEILTYIFNVCEFNLDSVSIETLINLKSSFNQIKFDLVKDEIYYWYHSEARQKNRDTVLTIQQIINVAPTIEAEILAKKEQDRKLEASGEKKPPVFYSVSLHSEGQVTSVINFPKQQKALEDQKTNFTANDNKYKTEIMELLDQSEHIKILIIPHPTCILTQAGDVIESLLTEEDYDNIFTIISHKPNTQDCCDKYISEMLTKDKQIAYGSNTEVLPLPVPLPVAEVPLLLKTQQNLTDIWSDDKLSPNDKKQQTADLLSSDPYIDHIVTNSSEKFKSEVNKMIPGSTLLGYTVEFKKDTSGKKSCRFIVPTGSTFKEISKMMISEPKFTPDNTDSNKMPRLRQLIAAIDAERSLCTGTNSVFPTSIVSGFSSLSKWGRGGRNTRKLNKRKLKRKKTKRYRSKKTRKTHKRR